MAERTSLSPLPLPKGVHSSFIDCTSSCGLKFHILSAGQDESRSRPMILLTHGYPEIAYSWRNIIPRLASKGYCVVALDQRGYGRTQGWDNRRFDQVDLQQFTMTNLVRDLVCLVYALGYTKVHCIIGHDFGAVASATAPLVRPDIFASCIQMSHPHHAPPTPPFAIEQQSSPSSGQKPTQSQGQDIQVELAQLDPPRKHYKWYNSTAPAASHWDNPPQGLNAFLRGYFHLKSADWAKNDPHPLKEWSAEELSQMPEYYVLPLASTMPEAVRSNMKGEDASATHKWLPEEDINVYVSEWQQTGFQGALNWYRAQTSSSPVQKKDMLLFAGRQIEVPCCFISGEKDWGNFQQPGALDGYKKSCVDFRGATFIPGAGHWVQQEQPDRVMEAILAFLSSL